MVNYSVKQIYIINKTEYKRHRIFPAASLASALARVRRDIKDMWKGRGATISPTWRGFSVTKV